MTSRRTSSVSKTLVVIRSLVLTALIVMSVQGISAAEPATQDSPGAANDEARELINADAVHENFGYTGDGLSAAIWGFGTAGDHQDLEADEGLLRLDDEPVSDHPTHVAGTMAGQGVIDSSKKGVAPDARILSYGLEASSTDALISETADSQNYGNVVSHNSWAWTSYSRHGDYDSFSKAYDRIVRGSPSAMDGGMSVVFPSANHRNDVDYDYNTIPGTGATAKNTITVGAVDQNREMTSFSSWGPTDNGRIKPDVVADGAFVSSTMPGDSYSYKRGTSVSAPAVSGGVVLINDAFQNVEGELPAPATVKAVMLHTTDDISTEGPDYRTGWGVPDMEAAVSHVERESSENVLETSELTQTGGNDSYTADFSSRGESQITLVWSDKAGSNGELVNDLDLEVKTSEGESLEPWKLDSSSPEDAATKGEDHTNPVEMVEVPVSAGEVRIAVEADSLEDSQSYSLLSDAELNNGQLVDEEKELDNETDSDTENDSETVNSGDETVSPELEVISPEKKTYRKKTVEFEAKATDVSEVYFELEGDTYIMEESSENTYTRNVNLQNGFQTADFTAVGENGEELQESVFFYAIVGTSDDSDSDTVDSENSDNETDSGSDDSDSSDDVVDEDSDSDTDSSGSNGGDEETDSSKDSDSDSSDGDSSGDGSNDDSSDSENDGENSDTVKVSDDTPPEIEIISPETGNSYSGKTEFKVGFDEEVKSAKLTLNRRKTYELEKNGDYYTGSYELEDGLNTMMFMGTDTSGNFNSETLTIRN